MKRIRVIAIIAAVAVILAVVIPMYVNSANAVTPAGIATSGFIEAVSVNIAPETGGRVAGITVSEGDTVKAGDQLVTLDATLLTAQRQQAEINLNLAKANVTQATLSKDNAQKAWENARDVQLKIAQVNLEEANNTFAKITYPYSFSTFAFDVPAAVAAINTAQLQLKEAQAWLAEGPASANYSKALDDFRNALDNLTTAQDRLVKGQGADVFATGRFPVTDFFTLRTAQLEMNKAQLSVQGTATAVDQAQTTYLQATNGIDIAGQQVKQAEAALNVIDVQMGKLTISSPISGIVAAKNIEVGEIAQAGTPVLTVTQLGNMTLTTYVPESQIGLVMLGQDVQVSIDSYPGQTFAGKVIYISPRASFTPGNIQLKDEREKTVFAVKISLANPDNKMKPGMPADAIIITQG